MSAARPAEALLHFCPLSLVSEFPLHELLSEYPALLYMQSKILEIFSIVILLIRTLKIVIHPLYHADPLTHCDDMNNLVLYNNL